MMIICSPKVRVANADPQDPHYNELLSPERLQAFSYRKYLIMKTVTYKNSVHLSGTDPKSSGSKTLLERCTSVGDL
jgi:hypothetical protein